MTDKYKKFVAFTLAEVLVTLAIIGVVAALTIPTVMKNYRRHQVETALKKNFSALQQALIKAQMDYGSMSGWSEAKHSGMAQNKDNPEIFVQKYIEPYLKVAASGKTYDELGYKEKPEGFYPNTYSLLLADGTIYNFHTARSGTSYGSIYVTAWIVWGVAIWADLNGPKGPNKVGKDIFTYLFPANGNGVTMLYEKHPDFTKTVETYASKKGITSTEAAKRSDEINDVYWGDWSESQQESLCRSKDSSNAYNKRQACGAIIKRNGWRIPDDYPWL